MLQGFSGSEFEAFICYPIAIATDIDFYYDRSSYISFERERFAIVAGHQVGIGIFVRLDAGVFPWSTFADGFSELPGIVNSTHPDCGFAVIGADDVFVVGRLAANAAEHKQSMPRAKILDHQVVCGNRTHHRKAAGIFGREFVKGATEIEQIALGRHLTGDASFRHDFRFRIVGCTARKTPAAAFVVDQQCRSLIDAVGFLGHARGSCDVISESCIVFTREFHVVVHDIETIAAAIGIRSNIAESECIVIEGAHAATDHSSILRLGQSGEKFRISLGVAGFVAIGKLCRDACAILLRCDANPHAWCVFRKAVHGCFARSCADRFELAPCAIAVAIHF